MNGAESLIKTLVDSGVEICFSNPGTSEMHFVAALDEVDGMRCVLCLFEGVLSGAADGYARMAQKPASTLLHLGPGLGNSLANLHNAKRANSPLVNIVGDHATYHVHYDAPLTADIEAVAAPMSHWVYTARSPADIAADGARAVAAAGHHQVATLILPADVSWGDNPNGAAPAAAVPELNPVPAEAIQQAAAMLLSDRNSMILFGGVPYGQSELEALARLGKRSGARICADTFQTRIAHGAGTPVIERLPYLAEMAIDSLREVENLIILGCKAPVSFFAYPDVPSVVSPEACEQLLLARPGDDIGACLDALVEALDAAGEQPDRFSLQLPALQSGELNVESAGAAFAHYLPEAAIVVDEGATSSIACASFSNTSPPHDWLALTGGAIGFGLPCAVGAALACPDRKVVCLEGDGSAMYTISALWTMARENLDITVVVFNNARYSILELEFARTGARGGVPGPKAASMLEIGKPDMDFAAMAQGMGVSATRATTAEAFNRQFAEAMGRPGPRLIDACVPTSWS